MTTALKCLTGINSRVGIVLGAQWGDEGKGKLVSILSDKYDISARFNGGNNTGHMVIRNGVKYAFHLVPSAIVSPATRNLLGNGVVVDLDSLFGELAQLDKNRIDYRNRMLVSDRAHLVTQYQIQQDSDFEKTQNLGTTKKGIGPTYAAKIQRFGLRIGDLVNWDQFLSKYERMASFYPRRLGTEELEKLKKHRDIMLERGMIVDSVSWLNKEYANKKRILVEGANASLLDIDLGTYPYVTSSSTSIGGLCTGLGFAPHKLETIIGVVKAYTTRVGEGPFPTQLSDSVGKELQTKGHEVGTTTGRPRRCGWLDLNLVKYTNMINGYTSLCLTKLDILDNLPEIKVGVQYKLNGKTIDSVPQDLDDFSKVQIVYETLPGWKKDISKVTKAQDLPKEAINYIRFIERYLRVPVSWVGTGPAEPSSR